MNQTVRKLKILAVPISIMVVLLVLAALGANFFFSRYADLNTKLKKEQKSRNTLENKLSLLESSDNTRSETLSSDAVIALPYENSTVPLLSHLRRISVDNKVFVSDISSQVAFNFSEEILYSEVVFNLTGDLNDVLTYLSQIKNIAPITRLNSISLVNRNDSLEVESSVSVFWSLLPETLPSVESPLTELSADEEELLGSLSTLQKPDLETINPEPKNPNPPQNPFRVLTSEELTSQ